MNKNLSLLTISQVFGFTAAIITVFLSEIIGSQITSIKSLSTLPTALSVVGNAIFTILAAKNMSNEFWASGGIEDTYVRGAYDSNVVKVQVLSRPPSSKLHGSRSCTRCCVICKKLR